jgi:lipoprotein-anchoring transpeptidase ErfK/SrfK
VNAASFPCRIAATIPGESAAIVLLPFDGAVMLRSRINVMLSQSETNHRISGYAWPMRARDTTTGLTAVSIAYLVGATAFGVVITLNTNEPWAAGIQQAVRTATPYVVSAANTTNERAIKPAVAWVVRTDREFFDRMMRPGPTVAQVPATPQKVATPVKAAKVVPPPVIPPKTAPTRTASLPPPAMELAQQPAAEPAPLVPAPDANPPSPGEISSVLSHLKASLTKELYANFDLFLYVSKADHGPWSQRMFVFQKQASGDLNMIYSFPVSTGREVLMAGPSGKMYNTNTPQGYFQLDRDRMYRRYHSSEWDHAMPYAMFFNWEHDGLQTGVAIHSATGEDIALLGKRSSAGCIRLHPDNAHLLYNLIRKNYRGLAPRFAYDKRTATMADDGLLMHDKAGNLEYTQGYKVLVLIENNGGDNVVAALF